jgi:dihydrofolate synthase/folylpolyglutamate synthase
MPKITTITEANEALMPFVPLVKQLTGSDTVFDRIEPLMALLGNPQNKTRIVHLAGTSGKTSTAYYVSALLRAAGKRVGLTVSPHVDSITERVQVNGVPLDEPTFCAYLSEFLEVVDRAPAKPSYFELVCAFSFWVFEREQVDYAVVETGMGGLFDATNIASRSDKLCIITDIGFDHMHILGNSLREITAQKIGIVHKGNPVIMYSQADEVNEVAEKWIAEQAATLTVTTEDTERKAYGQDFAADMPEFQQRNWLLAFAAYRLLQQRDGLPELDAELLRTTQALQVPGRMDRRHVGGKVIIMDGAHNGQKMETFLASFQHAYPGVKPAVLIALKEGKEPATVAPLLAPIASEIIVTTFNTSQDLPSVSIEPEMLAQIFHDAGAQQITVEPHQQKAFDLLLAAPGEVGIITGSFYLLSQLRATEQQGNEPRYA